MTKRLSEGNDPRTLANYGIKPEHMARARALVNSGHAPDVAAKMIKKKFAYPGYNGLEKIKDNLSKDIKEGSGPKEKQHTPYVDRFSQEGRKKTAAALEKIQNKLSQEKKAKDADKIGKKIKEADIPSSQGVDTRGAGLGVGRSQIKLEGKWNYPAMKRKLGLGEGAKVDRMVKHIEKSEEKLGKSEEKASDIAWATANKRGMLDNKNKKKTNESPETEYRVVGTYDAKTSKGYDTRPVSVKVKAASEKEAKALAKEKLAHNHKNYKATKVETLTKKVEEGDIPSSRGVDTMGAGLGAGRSATTLEGKKMSKQVNEIFGLSAKEKAAKADEALKAQFVEAMKINNIFEKSKAVDELALKAIAAGKGGDFFRALGFKSQVEYPKGWYQTMPYWSDINSDSPKPSYGTVYGMEALVGSPLTGNREVHYTRAKAIGDGGRGFKPGHMPSKIWAVDGGNNQTMLVWLHNANMSEGKKPDFLDLDKDGDKKEPMKKAAADKKKQKVKESMNHRITAARLEGKSHGIKSHAHCGKQFEDLEERKAYCDGYKDGLDELYEMGMYETAPPATVSGMADEEMLGELSPATYGSYVGKASASMHDLGQDAAYYREPGRFGGDAAIRAADKLQGKAERRHQGINKAVGKLSQPAMEDEFDEGIKDTLKKGALAAGAAATLGAGGMMAKGAYDYHKKDPAIGMSTYDMDRMAGKDFTKEDDFGEGNAFTGALAKTPKGGKFSVGGKSFTDNSSLEEYAFESWDRQLNSLLNEGINVSVSKGNNNTPDSVSITATDADAEQLLGLVKNAGLGLFGADQEDPASTPMSTQPEGSPDEVGSGGVDISVVDGHDGMMGLMQKLSGISGGPDDYEDEEGHDDDGHDHEHLYGNSEEDSSDEEESNEDSCMECGGMMEAGHSCGGQMDEEETDDQEEFEVSEDNAPDSDEAETSADEDAEAKEDAALAGADSKDEEEIDESMKSLLEKLSKLSEDKDKKTLPTSYAKGSEEEKVAKEKDKMVANVLFGKKSKDKEKVDEWANQVGKGPGKGTDAQFTQDIDFMTKTISGGLNKPKSTGQTTVPVLAGQDERTNDSNINDWMKLAGIKR